MAPLILEQSAQEQLANAYAKAKGPFPVKIDGQQDYVVMSTADYEQYCEPRLTGEEMAMIREDYASAMRGDVVDAQTALDEIRAKYGL